MPGMHFSLRWMFGLVSFLAIGCGLLVYATPILSRLTLTAVLVVLLTSVLAAACHAGERRMFWAGFALFGLAYGWIMCGSWESPVGDGPLRYRLGTLSILEWCHNRAPRTRSVTTMVQSPAPGMMMGPGGMTGGMPPAMGGPPMMGGGSLTTMVTTQPADWSDFAATGQSLFALAFAMLGGLIGKGCYRWAEQADRLQGQP